MENSIACQRVPKKFPNPLQDSTAFEPVNAYTVSLVLKGGMCMRETNDPNADLEDLIYEEGEGGPSER